MILRSADPLRRDYLSNRSRRDFARISLLASWSLEVVSWFARLLLYSRGRGLDLRWSHVRVAAPVGNL